MTVQRAVFILESDGERYGLFADFLLDALAGYERLRCNTRACLDGAQRRIWDVRHRERVDDPRNDPIPALTCRNSDIDIRTDRVDCISRAVRCNRLFAELTRTIGCHWKTIDQALNRSFFSSSDFRESTCASRDRRRLRTRRDEGAAGAAAAITAGSRRRPHTRGAHGAARRRDRARLDGTKQ